MPEQPRQGPTDADPPQADDRDAATGSPGERSAGALSPRAERALAALMSLDPAAAARVRERSPSRRRPRSQLGPRLDLGEDDPRL